MNRSCKLFSYIFLFTPLLACTNIGYKKLDRSSGITEAGYRETQLSEGIYYLYAKGAGYLGEVDLVPAKGIWERRIKELCGSLNFELIESLDDIDSAKSQVEYKWSSLHGYVLCKPLKVSRVEAIKIVDKHKYRFKLKPREIKVKLPSID